MSDNDIVTRILADLDRDVTPVVKNNLKIVEEFTKQLQLVMANSNFDVLHGASIIHAGSAYEKLVVKEKVDFDIVVVLGKPYHGDNFIVQRDPSRFFNLRWKSLFERSVPAENGYLDASQLQEMLFDCLTKCVKRVLIHNAEIRCSDGLASLDVLIKKEAQQISIDLSPQIAGYSWKQCPDIKLISHLPLSLKQYINNLEENHSPVMFFSPAVPGRHPNQKLLCNVGFTQLEKNFLVSNTKIRDMVRMVKFVADRLDWKKKYAMKSFYIKRVAIKYHGELQQKDLWNGYKALLSYLSHELTAGTIDGYFVKDLVTYRKKPEKIVEFRVKIAEVLQMNPREIQRLY